MLGTFDLQKADRRKQALKQMDAKVEAAARRLKRQLQRWIRRAKQHYLEEEIRRMRSAGKGKTLRRVEKASKDKVTRELERILALFGVREVNEAGEDMAARMGTPWVIEPQVINMLLEAHESKAKGIAGETKAQMQRIVRDVLQQALREDPTPSIAEISRRMRAELNSVGNVMNDAFRAERISRTEATQIQNTAHMEAMALAEVDEVEWVAAQDGRSGDRHHERMSGKRIPMWAANSTSGSARREWFRTPKGNRLPYPGWPGGAAEDVINCRCKIISVFHRGNRKVSAGKDVPPSSAGGRSGSSTKVLNKS